MKWVKLFGMCRSALRGGLAFAALLASSCASADIVVRVDWSASISDFPEPRDPGPGQLSGLLGVFAVNAVGDTFLLPSDGTLSATASGFNDGFPNGVYQFTRNFSSGPPVLEFLSIGALPSDFAVRFVDSNTGLLSPFPAPCTVNGIAGDCMVSLFDESNTGTDSAGAVLSLDGSTRPSVAVGFSFTVIAVCGNAAVEGPEACDDGNLLSGDDCSLQCENE